MHVHIWILASTCQEALGGLDSCYSVGSKGWEMKLIMTHLPFFQLSPTHPPSTSKASVDLYSGSKKPTQPPLALVSLCQWKGCKLSILHDRIDKRYETPSYHIWSKFPERAWFQSLLSCIISVPHYSDRGEALCLILFCLLLYSEALHSTSMLSKCLLEISFFVTE